MQDTKTEREAAAGTDGAEGQAEATKELTKQAEATKELTEEESAEGLAGMLHEREVSAEMRLAGLAGKETEESTGGQRNFLGLSASIFVSIFEEKKQKNLRKDVPIFCTAHLSDFRFSVEAKSSPWNARCLEPCS